MKKSEFTLEPYEVPKVFFVSAVVERGFEVSGYVGYDDVDKDDWQDGEDDEW